MPAIERSCYRHRNAKHHAQRKQAIDLCAKKKDLAVIQIQTAFVVHKILGIKMVKPRINAVMEAISTAPAAMSLISLISGRFSVEIKSMVFSMQVLNISADHTKPMANIIIIHSWSDI